MMARAGACEVCTARCVHAVPDERVVDVARGDWVEIRRCSVCGAYWDMQPANRPVVISLEEARRRVPDPDGWI